MCAVALHDALHDGQADAVAFELVGPVEALERVEQAMRARHVEPWAVVADEEDLLVTPRFAADLDDGMLGSGA